MSLASTKTLFNRSASTSDSPCCCQAESKVGLRAPPLRKLPLVSNITKQLHPYLCMCHSSTDALFPIAPIAGECTQNSRSWGGNSSSAKAGLTPVVFHRL